MPALKKFLILVAVFVVVGVIPALPVMADGDSIMISNSLAEGVGRTAAVALLSCLGLLYKRNKTLGFGIAAIIFTTLIIVSGIKQGTF